MKRPVIIGITGSIGTGKSTVARIFAGLGATIIDADKIAHNVIMPNGPVYKKVISLFGKSILTKDKRINRKKLGRIVFKDKKKLRLLNSLIHPEVIKRIRSMIKKKSARKRFYVIDVPLLIESGMHKNVDRLIVVTASRKAQVSRCRQKFGMSTDEITKRMRSQIPLSRKKRLAHFIIDNNGSIASAKKQARIIWEEIKHGAGKH